MLEVRKTKVFSNWLKKLKDRKAKARIATRIDRIEILEHFGEVKSVGEGVREMKIDYGPGYRLYFTKQGTTIVILLSGGDKSSQNSDIKKAQKLAKQLKD